jgi:hypothetical protein
LGTQAEDAVLLKLSSTNAFSPIALTLAQSISTADEIPGISSYCQA